MRSKTRLRILDLSISGIGFGIIAATAFERMSIMDAIFVSIGILLIMGVVDARLGKIEKELFGSK